MSRRTRCCCPCMCEFQADLLYPVLAVEPLQAPRCPECSELYDRKVEPHTGPAIIHGGIQYWRGSIKYGDKAQAAS